MNDALVSVIIPVYKVEKYLRQCIESVLAQTHHNLEIILIDDGSPDSCGDICEEYASRDQRIRVIHQKNHGMAHARNVGLDNASGEYITFVDSDDFIDERCISTLVDIAVTHGSQISCVEYTDYRERGHKTKKPKVSGKIRQNDNINYLKTLLYQTTGNSAVWGKLFSSELFKTDRFQEGIWYEDLEILSRLLLRMGITAWSNDKLYYYRNRSDSSMHSFGLRSLDVLSVTDRMTESYAKYYPELLTAARSRRLSAYFNIYCLMVTNHYKDPELAARCRDVIKKERKHFLFDRHVRLKNRLGILITYLGGFRLLDVIAPRIYH